MLSLLKFLNDSLYLSLSHAEEKNKISIGPLVIGISYPKTIGRKHKVL